MTIENDLDAGVRLLAEQPNGLCEAVGKKSRLLENPEASAAKIAWLKTALAEGLSSGASRSADVVFDHLDAQIRQLGRFLP